MYKTDSEHLCAAISDVAKYFCTKQVPAEHSAYFLASRLIPLDKDPSSSTPAIRPIGIGEVMRRIIGRAVAQHLKTDIQVACGTLQTAAGIPSGIEATVHAVKDIFDDEGTDAVILVDADNAFNRLNRNMALRNIGFSCPSIACYLHNTYSSDSKLYTQNGSFISSREGTTQGDNCASLFYSISTKPLINKLKVSSIAKQVWYADDASAAGKLHDLSEWWVKLNELGPAYGYFPKPSKTIVVLKDPGKLEEATGIFGPLGLTVTVDGERHLGAAVGSAVFRNRYVSEKVNLWVQDVERLADVAIEEPQAAYTAFVKSIAHRWTFLQRTIQGVAQLFQPLEDAIRNRLLTALVGHQLSDLERSMVALPVKLGGLGISNPVLVADCEYQSSRSISSSLTNLIVNQVDSFSDLDLVSVVQVKKGVVKQKEERLQQEYNQIQEQLPALQKRALEFAQEKGASSWLSCIPVQTAGYTLNKDEFRDSVSLRYGWKLKSIPKHCACGKNSDVDHLLSCSKGGYSCLRHNALRDTFASLLSIFCKDVVVEPPLIPTELELTRGTVSSDAARLDIAARGIWSPFDKTLIDVRVTHPNALSQQSQSLKSIFQSHEREKKRKYLERVLQVEKASFIPVVLSTTGACAPEANRLMKRMAAMISVRKKELYSDVMRHMRTKISFTLLKAALVSIRGFRGTVPLNGAALSDAELDFGLIPHMGDMP